MTAGGRTYFNGAFIIINLLRNVYDCSLPIEVFYAGSEELPHVAIQYMHDTYKDVSFIDITKMDDAPDVWYACDKW